MKEVIFITNTYIIKDNIATILIINRKGERFETIISLECLQKVIDSGYSWHIRYDKCIDGYYARATKYCGIVNGKAKYETILLHRFIMDFLNYENFVIDHINHNTLDNTKENLRITEIIKNTKNRSGRNSNNKSGYRNVSERDHQWVVQLQVNGVNTVIKKFPLNQLEEAGAYAKIKRKEIYGAYAGLS